jgi:hypothetical protein
MLNIFRSTASHYPHSFGSTFGREFLGRRFLSTKLPVKNPLGKKQVSASEVPSIANKQVQVLSSGVELLFLALGILGLTYASTSEICGECKTVNLAMIGEAKGDINGIRMLLKGDMETCLKLFREAIAAEDAILQIQLSQAYYGMKWGKDEEKDFSSLTVKALENFEYYPREFVLFNRVYDLAMSLESDWKVHETRGLEIFTKAAALGYRPAILELEKAKWRSRSDSYGFAVQLRPFVGQGDKQFDFFFGRALKNGSQIGSELYYEGLYWIERSDDTFLKYPRKGESFDDFKSRYIKFEDVFNTYYDQDGFLHVGGSVVLGPSKEAWEVFKKDKLAAVKISPLEAFQVEYNEEEIRSLMSTHNISMVCTSSFVEHPTQGHSVKGWHGESYHGFRIHSLAIYSGKNNIGEVSVQEDTFEIYQTIDNPKIRPLISFIENVMRKSGSASSADAWLRYISH